MTSNEKYRIMLPSELSDGVITLRPLQQEDIENIRLWRNAQMDVLRQAHPISPEEQVRYFEQHVWPEKKSSHPCQILLGIESNGVLIGYGGLVHIFWEYGRAEISFLLSPEVELDQCRVRDYFTRFVRLIQELAFDDLSLRKLTTETYEQRKLHIDVLESSGHKLEGRLRKHVIVSGRVVDALVHGLLLEDRKKIKLNAGLNILVTSSSRKIPLLRSLKEAASKLDYTTKIIAGDIDPQAVSRYEVDSFWQMPRLTDDGLKEIIDQCRDQSITCILPTRDAELDYWSNHRESLMSAGIEVIISSPEAIARCRDKLKFAEFAHSLGLPAIPAAMTPEAFVESPMVVKEQFGAGSVGIGLNLSYEEAVKHAKTLEQPIFQPFINGEEISIDSWIGKTGKVAGVVLRRRDRVIAGESQVTTTFTDKLLEKQAVEFISKLELRGPVVLQAFVSEGELHVIECNPRFGGASTASIAVGLDSLYWSLAEVVDPNFSPEFTRTSHEVRLVRMPVDLVIHDSHF